MASEAVQTDMGIGFAMVFVVVSLLGAVVLFAAPSQLGRAWGFAAAMVAAALAVVGLHMYE